MRKQHTHDFVQTGTCEFENNDGEKQKYIVKECIDEDCDETVEEFVEGLKK